jgi:hypothetical protein
MDDPIHTLITEDDLPASEARFRSVYENATIGMYRTTPDAISSRMASRMRPRAVRIMRSLFRMGW